MKHLQALTSFIHPLEHIFHNPRFGPDMDIKSFHWWLDKGFYRIGHFFTPSGPIMLKHCIDKLELPGSERFRFIQISHFLSSLTKGQAHPLEFTQYERWCGQALDIKGGISLIYASLMEPTTKFSYMEAWERDLQETWNLEEWHRRGTRAFQGIFLNISLIEANMKVLMRWYLLPSRLATMFSSASPLCFRDCQAQGSMLHIWWECLRLRGFWNKVFAIIRKVSGLPVTKSPQVALLNAPIPRTAKHTQKLITFMLLGAKTTIAKAWKQPTVSFQAAKRKISWIMSQEKLVSTMMDTTKSFEATWEPWARHLGIPLSPGIQTTRTS